MTSRSNYRVKVDLSKYHQDARRFSWIYVNSTNVWFISHLKRHIQKVFGINEPFHLLLNGTEYLPPAEDVRVLNENEIIVVEPGSGMSNDTTSRMSLPSSDKENGFLKDTSTGDVASYRATKKRKEDGLPNEVRKSDATMYHSILDVTEIESGSDSKLKDESMDMNFSAMETNSTTIDFHLAPPHKRKRIRRRKSLKQGDKTLEEKLNGSQSTGESMSNKPKIVSSCILPSSSTHIRFDNHVNDSETIKNELPSETSGNKTNCNESILPSLKNAKHARLASLLELKNCSSPLTFAPNKPKHCANGSEALTDNEDPKKHVDSGGKYSGVKPEEYPSLTAATEIGDVVAFKVLRMGNDYAPELSAYIIAETLAWCSKKTMYTFRILRGQEEIEGPRGKFSLADNEAHEEKSDTVEYNFCQLIEPRLIDRKSNTT